jgi:ATP-dependent exoDNAse (exonuclease V) alpha subunit
MAIYHCSVEVISRSKGHSSTAAAAYRAGDKIKDERTGELHDYTRKQNCAANGIVLPEGAPAEFADREKLWNAVEKTEKRSDAQLCRSFDMALPNNMPEDLQEQLIQEFCQEQFADHGMIADWSIHRPKPRNRESKNDHAHVLTTMRDVDQHGFGKKNRSWNDKDMVNKWRESWANKVNEYIDRYQIPENHIDHRSLKDQEIDRLPQKHLGKAAKAMERRGMQTDRGDHNREIQVMNENMEANKEYLRKYAMGVIEHNRRAAENIESVKPYLKAEKLKQTLEEQIPGHERMRAVNDEIVSVITGSGLLSEQESNRIRGLAAEISDRLRKVLEEVRTYLKIRKEAEPSQKMALDELINKGEQIKEEHAARIKKFENVAKKVINQGGYGDD